MKSIERVNKRKVWVVRESLTSLLDVVVGGGQEVVELELLEGGASADRREERVVRTAKSSKRKCEKRATKTCET